MALHDEYEAWMGLALVEAREAADAGEVPVGAVVVDPLGEVLSAGRNRREEDADPAGHAELIALRAAAAALGQWRLEDCTLVTTLEPCPMCAGAAISARVGRVVFGAWDPKLGAAGSVWDLLRDRRLTHRPEVVAGISESECSGLLNEFFTALR
jgi:tRNA(adenine34) deaminase